MRAPTGRLDAVYLTTSLLSCCRELEIHNGVPSLPCPTVVD